MQIQNLITKTELINWRELKDLQPVDLKNHYHGEKVKQSIIKNGFASAIYVWQDPETNDILIVDGHCRHDVLMELYNEGYKIPDKLPCTFIDNTKIKTRKQAIKTLLEVFNLKTNPINKDNLDTWLKLEELPLEELKLEELHIEDVEDWQSNLKDKYDNIDEYEHDDKKTGKITITCRVDDLSSLKEFITVAIKERGFCNITIK
jgi:hypothetical protein